VSACEVSSSAELMENYLHADVLRPQKKFTALQTDAGTALLFSISTDDELVVTKEVPGSRYGWEVDDLSKALIGRELPTGATCTEFAATQEAAKEGEAGTIRLAMVLNDGQGDHLYVSLGNSESDTSWTQRPQWTACPFNARDAAGQPLPAPSPLQIVGVFISEASDGEFIAVDVARNPGSPVEMVARYHLDVSDPANPSWIPHALPIDLEVGGYTSCLGRSARASGVDGIYTGGKVGGSAQLIYTPLWNAFDPKVPPTSAALNLPGGAIPEALAAVRNPDNTSDLYVVADEQLFCFVASNQKNGATGELLLRDQRLRGIRAFFASGEEGVTVWGLNGDDEVFYVAWPSGEPPRPGDGRSPAVILAGADAISPYVNRQYSANSFFAHTGEGLTKAVKSAATGIWTKQKVTLPPTSLQQEALAFSSYTTRLQVNDDEGRGVPEASVALTAVGVTGVYIGHHYYVIGPTPTEVKADAQGAITIVESVKGLAATRFTATVGDAAHEVNPMNAPFERSSKLDSVASLQEAVITDKKGGTRPFVPSGTGEEQLQGVAASNKQLATAYESLADKPLASLSERPLWATRSEPPEASSDFVAESIGENSILTDLGDLFSWLESGIEAVISIVENAAEDAWYFVAKIADQVYHGVLDCVETVVAAVAWVYNAIKVAIEDIIKFLEFLFAWPDILVTHRVMKNVFTQFVAEAIGNLGDAKAKLGSTFDGLRADVDTWANIPPFGQTANGVRKENGPLPAQSSAPANLGVHHFEGNVTAGSTGFSPSDPGEAIFQDLIAVLEREGGVLTGAFEAVEADVIAKIGTLTITEIAEKLVAILADTLIETTENVLEAALDVLIQLTEGMMELFTATIDIPVISTLYRMISDEDLSILDALCLIAAIPATLIYKGIANAAPFPRGDAFTEGLLAATSFEDVRRQFFSGAELMAAADADPVLDEAKLKIFGVVSGVFAFVGSIAAAFVSTLQKTLDSIGVEAGYPKMLAAVGAVANVAYVSPNLASAINVKTSNWYADLNSALMYVSILKGIAAIPLATTESPAIKWMFPAVETGINVIWNVPVIMNIIVNKDKWDTTDKALIPESIGNFAFNLGGMMELPTVAAKDPGTKAALILTQDGLMVLYGIMMVVAGGIADAAADA
jgi:hypothetical protein